MNVLTVDMEADNCIDTFGLSLKNTGFAVLENHPIPIALIDDVYQEWSEFFKNPSKLDCLFNREMQDGFFPMDVSETAKGHQEKDIKEFFQYYPWGQFPSFLSKNTHLLYEKLTQLATTLLDWTEQILPKEVSKQLSMPLSKMIEGSNKTMLRVIHYPPLSGSESPNAVRAAAHGDINLLTILVGATNAGLQVQDSCNKWHNVSLDKHKISVNIGDMLQMCTNGYLKSTLHRVINPDNQKNQSRLSMPLFLHPASQVRLSPDYLASEYLEERLKELGVK